VPNLSNVFKSGDIRQYCCLAFSERFADYEAPVIAHVGVQSTPSHLLTITIEAKALRRSHGLMQRDGGERPHSQRGLNNLSVTGHGA
jgi:hypothetical protein